MRNCCFLFSAILFIGSAAAQDDPDAPLVDRDPVGEGVTKGDGPPPDQAVTISGFVDARYLNSSEDASNIGSLPSFGTDASSFQMAEGEIDIAGVIEGVEYQMDFQAFGTTGGASLFENLEQAFVRFHFPVQGYDLHVTGGQFNSPMGYEKQDAPDIKTVTHSFLQTAFVPKNLTGLIVGTDIKDNLSIQVSLTNPWDTPIDVVSEGNTLGVHFRGRATDAINWGASAMLGREEALAEDERLALDAWVRVNIAQAAKGSVRQFYLLGEVAMGEQEMNFGPRAGDHEWLAIRAEAHIEMGGSRALDRLGMTVRLERVDVEMPAGGGGGGHVLTGGLINAPTNDGGEVTAFSVAAQYRVKDNMRFAVELLNASGDLVLANGADDFRQIALQFVATFPAIK